LIICTRQQAAVATSGLPSRPDVKMAKDDIDDFKSVIGGKAEIVFAGIDKG
jgi:hypothetical protein